MIGIAQYDMMEKEKNIQCPFKSIAWIAVENTRDKKFQIIRNMDN